ncbi:MAG: GntR family transcriptional regulator [Pseudomonadota bacterium]
MCAARAKPNDKVPLSDIAYRELKKLILENQLPSGNQYMEQEVAELLNMSRTPIREALIKLSNEGLVEVRARHGMRVKPVSVDDMREIYEVLTSLESTAAELAAKRGLTLEETRELSNAVDEMESALQRDDLNAWAAADERFHRLLVKFSNNARLIALVDNFIDQSHRVRMMTLRLRPKPVASVDDHRAVLQAILAKDADAARARHHEHREVSGEMLVKLLNTHNLTNL